MNSLPRLEKQSACHTKPIDGNDATKDENKEIENKEIENAYTYTTE
jgi:hypothetical protein